MDSLRFQALKTIQERKEVVVPQTADKISDIFGIDVFTRKEMHQYLSSNVYDSVINSIECNNRINREVADQVAEGMKMWAISKGATHYAHWFLPLNEYAAEKHNAFLYPKLNGSSFESFKGNLLVQQEPDASSFPSGGLRNTFEARGYTAWDPSSPAFIFNKTLCIPSIFISYNGEALDYKTPLLKSMAALDKAAVAVCQLFDKEIKRVTPILGWEQEYFLVDEALFDARPDLAQAGRTLMGHTAAKDQQLGDHYLGTIPTRIALFIKDFENTCYRLGIPIKTCHNEVAPNQFECAPMYEEANIAVDHNVLLMTVMRSTAARHHLQVLFHEKPFVGVNGSGKHCNWSMETDQGVNLLAPGHSPRQNIQFLTFFVCVLKAVNDYSNLLMSTVLTASNSLRLGSSEAPNTIMSVFTGDTLSKMLDSIEKRITQEKLSPDEKGQIKLDIGKIPEILLDNTDRNRTSPFAFTGNRFEYRTVGSSSNCSAPLIALNTCVTEALTQFNCCVEEMVDKGRKKDEAILQTLRDFIVETKSIRFEGNSYGEEWLKEAAKRGFACQNLVSFTSKEYINKKNVELFEKHHVMSAEELRARFEILNETTTKVIQLESRIVADMAVNHIIPTAVRYQNVLIENIKGIKEVFPDQINELAGDEIYTLQRIIKIVNQIRQGIEKMTETRHKIYKKSDMNEKAGDYETKIKPMMDTVRSYIDELEMIVDDAMWPLPKYRELLASFK